MVYSQCTQDAPAIDHLIKSYPEFVTIDSLPVEEGNTHDDKVSYYNLLYIYIP